jgi:hypothetical protein
VGEADILYFRDERIAELVRGTLASLHKLPARTNTDQSAFYSAYMDLVALFEAVSLGDATFGALLLAVALDTESYPVDFRRCLFVDHPDALRSISAPYPSYLSDSLPLEQDAGVLTSLASSIQTHVVTPLQNPGLCHFARLHMQSETSYTSLAPLLDTTGDQACVQ